MFGEEWRIQPEFPNYFLDYRQETSPEARWQDRVTSQTAGEWSGNVFDFFERAYEKMRQALRVPFRLDGNGRRVDETPAHDALREAIANCLVNADYDGRRGVVLLWKEDGFHLSNPGGFRIPIEDAYVGGSSDPRNGTMMKMFNLVNIGERAGSGVPNMVEDWMSAGYGRPVLSERVNPERSTIFLPLKESAGNKRQIQPADSNTVLPGKKGLKQGKIIEYLTENGASKSADIAESVGLSVSRTNELLKEMIDEGKVTAQGKARARRYSASR